MSIDKENLSKMIKSLVNDDGESFTADFDSIMRDRISSEIAVTGLDIHSSLMDSEEPDTNESVELDEIDRTKLKNKLGAEVASVTYGSKKHTPKTNKQAKLLRKLEKQLQKKENVELGEAKKIHSDTFTFNSPATLKKFVDAVKQAGGGRKGIAGPDIHIQGNSVYIDVADKNTLDILSLLAKDFKAKTTKTKIESVEFIDVMRTVLKEGTQEIYLMDENSVFIDNKIAKSLVRLHDSLNNDNQKVMRDLVFESKEGYNEILELAKETENDII